MLFSRSRVRNLWHRSCKFERNLLLSFTKLVNMDTRVSLEVFFVKTNEICHTYKSKIHLCLRLSKYWGSWSYHSKSKQNISIKHSSIPSLEFLKQVCKKQKIFEIGSSIHDKHDLGWKKKAWTGFWNVLFVYYR